MKLRYYLRGLGIGIVVTALIMGFSDRDERPLTDAEIKAKAATLGMVESGSVKLADVAVTPETGGERQTSEEGTGGESGEKPEEEINGESGEKPEGEIGGESAEKPEEEINGESGEKPEGEIGGESVWTPATESGGSPEEESAQDSQPQKEETDEVDVSSAGQEGTVFVTIESGSDSGTVCRQLEEAGVIESAASFDKYLIDNGYSKRISTGTYEIQVGLSEEEVAKLITKTR